jgi:hypothetical protein
MNKYFNDFGLKDHLIKEGYFFDAIYIDVNGKKCAFDMNTWSFITNKPAKGYFSFSPNTKTVSVNNKWLGTSKCIEMEITWNYNNRKTGVKIQKFDNPQIDNNINIINPNIRNSYGLCMRNYKPRLMKVASLANTKSVSKKVKRAKNKYTNKKITKNNETWLHENRKIN